MVPKRIFLSSTAEDLKTYRQKVSDQLRSMGLVVDQMEVFPAIAGDAMEVCAERVRQADAVVVIVAHRYGFIPPAESDAGERSITWLEVEAALQAGKDVLAFVVDPEHKAWPFRKESDALNEARTPEEEQRIIIAVRQLNAFKRFLDEKFVRARFTTEDDLASKVTASVHAWLQKQGPALEHGQPLPPRIVHPLRPARFFVGREQLLKELHSWWDDPKPPDRVRVLMGKGGSGKTALAERVLQYVCARPPPGGVFVWSFGVNPKTEDFLDAAVRYFAPDTPADVRPGIQHLQRVLERNEQRLLILDNLETVQALGDHGRPRGELEDHTLMILLTGIVGGMGRTRALVTSRFELVDLASWSDGKGYASLKIDDLEPTCARDLLRAWEVKGADAELERLAASVGCHALSLDVLGSYIGKYCQGDLAEAANMRLEDLQGEQHAERLSRVLHFYARSLEPLERDLLTRLAVYPRGLDENLLNFLAEASPEVAGNLKGVNPARRRVVLGRLCELNLAHVDRRDGDATYTVHPFIRDFFRGLLNVPAETLSEAISQRLKPTLDARPGLGYPSEPRELDAYERLIEFTRTAGRPKEALEIVRYSLGGYGHLAWELGEHSRGARILAGFAPKGDPRALPASLSLKDRAVIGNAWGLFNQALGDVSLARRCLQASQEYSKAAGDARYTSTVLQNLADLERRVGALPAARRYAQEALRAAHESREPVELIESHAILAATLHAMGDVQVARHQFTKAHEHAYGGHLVHHAGLWFAEHLFQCGQVNEARLLVEAILRASQNQSFHAYVSSSSLLLGLILEDREPQQARNLLANARTWLERTKHVPQLIQAHLLAARLALRTSELAQARREVTSGLHLAGSCGLGLLQVDLFCCAAELELMEGHADASLRHAVEAWTRAAAPEMGDAWGEADALHWKGMALEKLGRRSEAEQAFQEEAAKRRGLTLSE